MRVAAVLLCWLVGCAGKSSHSVNDEKPGIAGSAAAPGEEVGGAGGGGRGGAAGSSSFGGLSLGGGDAAGAAGSGGSPSCSGPASCGIEGESYVIVEDGPIAASMASPIDDRCAHCRVPCEDCAVACEVSATGSGSCGSVQLSVAVCAGERQVPPCLNTVAEPPYYIDASGKSWPVVSLSGEALSSLRVLEASLTLVLRDGSEVRTLPARVRVCAELSQTLVPCKKIAPP